MARSSRRCIPISYWFSFLDQFDGVLDDLIQLTIAYLREKPVAQPTSTPTTPSSGGGVRSAAARFLGTGNGSRALSFVGGNGVSRGASGSARIGGSIGASTGSSSSPALSNYDGKGAYLIFNAGDTLFISDLYSQDKVFSRFP